jgi:hypothetical protein
MCKILGVQVPGAQGSTHYVLLDQSAHSSILESEDADALAIAK